MGKLKPCPFCNSGGILNTLSNYFETAVNVSCNGEFDNNCIGLTNNAYFDTTEEAIKAWNTRHYEKEIADSRDEIESLSRQLFNQDYHGNSIGWIYQQWEKDKEQLDVAWKEVAELSASNKRKRNKIKAMGETRASEIIRFGEKIAELKAENEILENFMDAENMIQKWPVWKRAYADKGIHDLVKENEQLKQQLASKNELVELNVSKTLEFILAIPITKAVEGKPDYIHFYEAERQAKKFCSKFGAKPNELVELDIEKIANLLYDTTPMSRVDASLVAKAIKKKLDK